MINEPEKMTYNALEYIECEEDVEKFVDTLIANAQDQDKQTLDKFWNEAERALLGALVSYVALYAKKKDLTAVKGVVDELAQSTCAADIKSTLGEFFEEAQVPVDSYAAEMRDKFTSSAAPKTQKDILIFWSAALEDLEPQE